MSLTNRTLTYVVAEGFIQDMSMVPSISVVETKFTTEEKVSAAMAYIIQTKVQVTKHN